MERPLLSLETLDALHLWAEAQQASLAAAEVSQEAYRRLPATPDPQRPELEAAYITADNARRLANDTEAGRLYNLRRALARDYAMSVGK